MFYKVTKTMQQNAVATKKTGQVSAGNQMLPYSILNKSRHELSHSASSCPYLKKQPKTLMVTNALLIEQKLGLVEISIIYLSKNVILKRNC